ncbi:MAG TPA: hypothetical protein V6C69_22350 [Trichormus sp.]
MSDLPCPKCGGKMDGVGSKLVCGDCYHVVDQNAPAPQAAPKVAKDPNAPLPTFAEAPAATLAPGVCPKCNGQTSDVGGRLVCGQCYWVVDQGRAPLMPSPMATSQTAAPGGFSMMHLGIIITLFFLVILVVMVQSLNKMPPPNMNSQQLPFGLKAPGAPTNPATAPTGQTPTSPTAVAPASPTTVPTSPQTAPAQGTQPQLPPSIVPQGGVTGTENSQPQLPPTIVPQGGVGVGTNH